jgi:hypothetical protein
LKTGKNEQEKGTEKYIYNRKTYWEKNSQNRPKKGQEPQGSTALYWETLLFRTQREIATFRGKGNSK